MRERRSTARQMPGYNQDRRLVMMLLAPGLVVTLGLVFLPLGLAIYDSFFATSTLTGNGPFVGLDNYARLFSGGAFLPALGRSVVWALSNVLGQAFLGLAFALLLHERFRGRTWARGLVMVPYFAPIVVIALIWRFLLNPTYGFLSALEGAPVVLGHPSTALWMIIAVNVWRHIPFMMVLLLAQMQPIPVELYEAARIDGCGYWRSFRYITLPFLLPALAVAVTVRLIWSFGEFDLPYLMAYGGPLESTTTIPILIRSLTFDSLDMGMASAAGTMLAGLLAIIYGLYLWLRAKYEPEQQ